MNSPVNQYYALPVEEEPADDAHDGLSGNWAKLEWPGIAEGYQISDLGQVLSPVGTLLQPGMNGRQLYLTLRMHEGNGKGIRLDKLVMRTFVGEPTKGQVPLHADGDPRNCRSDNLSYGPPPPIKTPRRKSPKVTPVEEDELLSSEPLSETWQWLTANDSSAGVSVEEVSVGLGITRGTATWRLNRLIEKGLAHRLRRGYYRPGAKAAPRSKVKPKAKGTKPKSRADYDTIEVSRTYRHRGTGLSVTVGEDGKAKMPKLNLSAAEMRAVSLLSQRIAEMNEILGLGRK